MKNKIINKIIISLVTIILLAINLLFIYLVGKKDYPFLIAIGVLIVLFMIYRFLISIMQKILVKCNILKYVPDNFIYYGDEKSMREQCNVEYKMQKDIVFSGWLYNIIFIIIMTFILKYLNNTGIISGVILALIVSIPSLIFVPRLYMWDGYGNRDTYEKNAFSTPQKNKKIRAMTWDFGGYKETTYRDENGNKVGTATTFDWGPVTDTVIKDKDGNKTKIEHWK